MQQLSPREQDVLVVLATGPDTYDDAAKALGVSRNTLRAHLCSMRRKTGAKNMVQLLRWAFRAALKAQRRYPGLAVGGGVRHERYHLHHR